ncbi:MAG: hypothetical protein LUQ25_06430 [Methanoregulaceae archaeon]|nr:hypothetical protein [Methanoregulaceae archaeon]
MVRCIGMDPKRLISLAGMPAMLLLVEIGAVLLALPLQQAGIQAFEDPGSATNPILFLVILLAFTAFMLLLIRFGRKSWIGIIIGISIFFTFIYIYSAIANVLLSGDLLVLSAAVILSAISIVILYRFPEWYVIDSLGILIAAGAASIFGISLEVLPVIVLLCILAVYDAISVYKTKHMITLAEGVIDLKTPILFVIPKRRDYSFIREGIGTLGEGEERGAYVMGMGDLIMPSILVVSANVFLSGPRIGIFTVPALGAIAGSLAGIALLLFFVNKGKPQAGLPPINSGAIIGFLLAWVLAMP